MKFLFRSLLVLMVAVVFGVGLYYAVQALPMDAPNPSSPEIRRTPESGSSAQVTPRPERPNKDRGGIGWRSILEVGRRVVVFSAMVFIAVLAKNYFFERKPDRKKPFG